MERRLKKYDRQLSPDRAKVWTEKSPKYHYNGVHNQQQLTVVEEHRPGKLAAVVYYLCRNSQLDHPHFLEVSLSSDHGLYLRDVIERLNVLRGRGMASKYSWSCKRSYKNNYVWHDLCEDDLILPANGNEYVLKGSELFEESTSRGCFSPVENGKLHTPNALPEPPSSISQADSSSPSSKSRRVAKHLPEGGPSPPAQQASSSSVSPESSVEKDSSWNGSLSLTEFKVYKSDSQADASTQTDENITRASESQQNEAAIVKDSVSPACSSSASSSGGRTNTLESLIRSDASNFKSFRILHQEESRPPSSTKIKASNVLMQLISCGSIPAKDHNFGLVPSYKPSFLHSRFLMLGDVDFLSENSRYTGLKLEDKVGETPEETSGMGSKCIPRAIKGSLLKQPRNESMRSPLSDGPRISSGRIDGSSNISSSISCGGSERFTGPTSTKKQSSKSHFYKHEEKVTQIEERLASGARVIIQSKAWI